MASKVSVQPIGPRVLIKPDEAKEEKTSGGLYIPPTAQDDKKPEVGVVVALGQDKDHTFKVKVGDKVFFKKYSPEEIKVDEEMFYVIEEDDVLAVIK